MIVFFKVILKFGFSCLFKELAWSHSKDSRIESFCHRFSKNFFLRCVMSWMQFFVSFVFALPRVCSPTVQDLASEVQHRGQQSQEAQRPSRYPSSSAGQGAPQPTGNLKVSIYPLSPGFPQNAIQLILNSF